MDSSHSDATGSTRSLTGFIKKHDRVLSYIGAILVLATFVMKENFREEWKESAEAMERKLVALSISTQIADLQRESFISREDVQKLLLGYPQCVASDKRARRPALMPYNLAENLSVIGDISRETQQMQFLMLELPNLKEARKSLEDLKVASNAYRSKVKTIQE